METTLYMKYGSRVTSGMAECLYDRLLDDPELAPSSNRWTSTGCASMSRIS